MITIGLLRTSDSKKHRFPCSQKAKRWGRKKQCCIKGEKKQCCVKGATSKAAKCFSQWWGLKFTINIIPSFNAVLPGRFRIASKPFTPSQGNTKTSENTLLLTFHLILFPSSSSSVSDWNVILYCTCVSRLCPSTKQKREKKDLKDSHAHNSHCPTKTQRDGTKFSSYFVLSCMSSQGQWLPLLASCSQWN